MRTTPTPIASPFAWLAVVAFVLFGTPAQRLAAGAQVGGEASLASSKSVAGLSTAQAQAVCGQRVPASPFPVDEAAGPWPVAHLRMDPPGAVLAWVILPHADACGRGRGPSLVGTVELRI